MRILVTGGAGYIGSVFTTLALSKGHIVTDYDSLKYGGVSLLSHAMKGHAFLIVGDILDAEKIKLCMNRQECIVHLAAIVGESACLEDEVLAWNVNYKSTKKLYELWGTERPFIFASTCSNYGISNGLATEKTDLNPQSHYAKSKVAAEMFLMDKPNVKILRLGTICGVSPLMRFDLIVGQMAKCVAYNKEMVFYSPKSWRPFLHVVDAARIIESVCGYNVPKGVYNVVGENKTKEQLASLMRFMYPNAQVKIKDNGGDGRSYQVDSTLIARQTELACPRTVEEALDDTVMALEGGVFKWRLRE